MNSIPSMDDRNVVDIASNRTKVFNLIKDRSFGLRRITLASGRESDFYFDMKPTMLSPEGAALLPEIVLSRLQGLEIDYAGGLAMGAVPLISALAMASFLKNRPLPAFFVRKALKDHGTRQLIEGLGPRESLQGKRVAILDDVTTTGGSAMEAVRAAQEAGAAVVLVLAVVDREEGASEFYREHGLAFDALFRAGEFLRAAGAR